MANINEMYQNYLSWYNYSDERSEDRIATEQFCALHGQRYSLEDIREFEHNRGGGIWSDSYRKPIEEYYKKRLIQELLKIWIE